MNIQTRIHPELRLREQKIEGAIDVPGLQKSLAAFYQLEDYDPDMDSLWDLTEADFRGVKTEEVRALAEMVSKQWGADGQSRAALVVAQDLGFGLARMYEILLSVLDSPNVKVFRSMEEAKDWLEAPREA